MRLMRKRQLRPSIGENFGHVAIHKDAAAHSRESLLTIHHSTSFYQVNPLHSKRGTHIDA
jgi:hypothetical protein